jgi:phosphoketolase
MKTKTLTTEQLRRMDAYWRAAKPVPGTGGPALVGNTYLEGTYSEIYPSPPPLFPDFSPDSPALSHSPPKEDFRR